jgi:hypothetical protein
MLYGSKCIIFITSPKGGINIFFLLFWQENTAGTNNVKENMPHMEGFSGQFVSVGMRLMVA